MKRLKIGVWLMRTGIAVFFIENIYFGWNEYPMSKYEEYADYTFRAFIYVGWFLYLTPLLDLYRNAVNNLK